ncbi:MAG: DUF2851 family protein [Lentimicrobiaceae bacterium]|nr:DUF2851 family protein [Lentimicrobiaceae bacterium]
MKEEFIYYLWENRLLHLDLKTTDNEEITILSVGIRNHDSGADFVNARIKIGDALWAGQVEIHVRASDWFKHNHHNDANYDSVILHVVYENDTDSLKIPTLEIKDKFDLSIFHKYNWFFGSRNWIPCGEFVGGVQNFTLISWLDRMLVEHLENECKDLDFKLKNNHYDWEQAFYQRLMRYFGLKVNNDSFEYLSRILPLNLLLRHRDNDIYIESMMFGCAGFLERDFEEDYPSLLKRDFMMLKSKFGLKVMPLSNWKFLRLRPPNFPTIRIAQLAKIITKNGNMFSKIRDADDIQEIRDLFDVELNSYWDNHFQFDKTSKVERRKILGKTAVDLIIINAIVPMLFYYGHTHSLESYKEKAMSFLEQIEAEDNMIIRNFQNSGVVLQNAFQTQAILYMYKYYCKRRRCLECRIYSVLSRRCSE